MKRIKLEMKKFTKLQKECINLGFNFLNARLHSYGFIDVNTYDGRIYYYEDDECEYMFEIIFPTIDSPTLYIQTANKYSSETLEEIFELLGDFSEMAAKILTNNL